MPALQHYKNHTRWDPIFHLFIAPILLLNIIVTGVWYGNHRVEHRHIGAWAILIAVTLFLLAFKTRTYAVKVQDRVIRLEERLRLAALLPAGEVGLAQNLTTPQLIALRFASDVELPTLARRALSENLKPKQIKESIIEWRPDHHRV